MSGIPSFFLNMIKDVPEATFEKVLKTLKITEKDSFKKYAQTRASSQALYGDFVLGLFSYDKRVVASLYKSIEGVLFIGGCAPGFGIAFNLIDACFCYILGNWLGCFVAIVSCFPIPGFKIVGKGLEKFLLNTLKKISPAGMLALINRLGKKLSSIGFQSTNSYIIIRQQIEKFIPELHNPFAETIIRELSKVIRKFPVSEKAISKSVCKTGEELLNAYSIRPKKLLELSTKATHL